jgi:hypothetical protein
VPSNVGGNTLCVPKLRLVAGKLLLFNWTYMTRNHLETAIREGTPFEIRMADGRSYVVPDALHIFLGKVHAVVIGEEEMPTVLPLLTMTGVAYLKQKSDKPKRS